jgi:hypothetical protein
MIITDILICICLNGSIAERIYMLQEMSQFTGSTNHSLHSLGRFTKLHQKSIAAELRTLGVDKYDFLLPETHSLPYIIHHDEQVMGIVYGRYKQNGVQPSEGRGALVATNNRILLIDKKPLFLKCDELSYRIISGISHTRVGPVGTVTLHTRAGDIQIRTLNKRCADTFVAAIEAFCFDIKTPPSVTARNVC